MSEGDKLMSEGVPCKLVTKLINSLCHEIFIRNTQYNTSMYNIAISLQRSHKKCLQGKSLWKSQSIGLYVLLILL